jgi:hypothetical protein
MSSAWRSIALAAAASLAASAGLLTSAAWATGEPPKVTMKSPEEIARANAPVPTRVAPLTVEATKPRELRQQTFDFVELFAASSVKLDQIARWTQPVCVRVIGLPDAADAEVKARLEEVANALNVGVMRTGCKANIQVAFTDQPQALLDRVANEHELLLGYWHHRDRDKLKAVTHPIQAWYVTGTGGSGGNTAGTAFEFYENWGVMGGKSAPHPNPQGVAGQQRHGFQLDDEEDDRGTTGCGDNPHFTGCLASQFQHVLVVVDISKVGGYPPGLIADYVVMVALAQPKSLDGCNVLPSVIDLFSKACPGESGQDGLTRADVAYLTSLYKMNIEARKRGQMTEIAGRMADMLLKANKTDQLKIQASDK